MKQVSKNFIFWLVAIAQFMVVLDVSIVNVGLKDIQQTLSFSQSSLQWVITAYTLAFGGFLLLGGRLADLFGRRRILLTGLAGFSLFSLLTGLSVSPLMMIVMRGLQGLSAALMSPSALSTVLTLFTEQKERNKALGYWTIISTAGAAVGLLLGGALSQYINWRWNFFINVPVGLLLFLGLLRYGAIMNNDAQRSKLDVPGAMLVTGGLVSLVLAISQAPSWGWLSLPTIGAFLLGIVLIAAFIRNETRHSHPLAPMRVFKTRNVMGANLMIMLLYSIMFGQFYLLSLYMQTNLHYAPFTAGLAFLPFPIILGILSQRVSGWVSRFGYKRFLLTGPWLIIAGVLWLTHLPAAGAYWTNLLPAMILLPLGISLTATPILVAATSNAREGEAGLVSGMVNTSQQLGGALGLSILAGIATSAATANAGLGQAAAAVRGDKAAFVVAIGFMLLALVVAATTIREHKAQHASQQDMPVVEAA